jgi:hypothetical protein
VEKFGQRNSRCLVGSIRPFYQPIALCLPIACVIEDRSLRIKVEDRWHVCEQPDQKIFSTSVTIECPDPRRICPTFFCPFDCLGTDGQCDYNSGKCLCEYMNITGNGTIQDDCGMEEEVEEVHGSTLRPILRPDEPGRRDPAVPPPDHTLSDYYVADAQSLEDNSILEAFAIALVSLIGILVLSFLGVTFYVTKLSKQDNITFYGWFAFFQRHDTNMNDGADEGDSTPNPNKDKMIASVLVDMRIRTNEQWRRRRGQGMNESVDATEGRLTESEAASGPDNLSDMSSRRSEACSDVETSQDDINVEDLPPEVPEEPQVIRRRRVLFLDAHS